MARGLPGTLSVPLKDRRALVVPVNPASLWPSLESYERLLAPFRHPKIDVFGLLLPFGVVPERTLVNHPEIFVAAGSVSDRGAKRLASCRIRAWLDTDAIQYSKVVLIVHGPDVPVWSFAVRGAKRAKPLEVAERVALVKVNRRTGFRGTLLQRDLGRHLTFPGSRECEVQP
jgi:hypothetical protein